MPLPHRSLRRQRGGLIRQSRLRMPNPLPESKDDFPSVARPPGLRITAATDMADKTSTTAGTHGLSGEPMLLANLYLPCRPVHWSSRHQSQGHASRSRQTECQHRTRPNHRQESKTPDPMGHAIPAGTPPRRRCAFNTHNRLTLTEIVTHTKFQLAQSPYLNNPTQHR